MSKYIKDNKIINATEKAYKVLFQERGYTPCKEVENSKEEKGSNLSKLKKEELLKIAADKGIEISADTTKENIINLIKEVENSKKEEAN